MNFLRSLFFRATPAATPNATASLAKNRLASVIADQRALARMEQEVSHSPTTTNAHIPTAAFATSVGSSGSSGFVHPVPSTVVEAKHRNNHVPSSTRMQAASPSPTQLSRPSVQYSVATNNDGNQLESIFGLGPKIKSKLQAELVMTVQDLAHLSDARCESLKKEQNMTTIFLLRSRAQERLKELKR